MNTERADTTESFKGYAPFDETMEGPAVGVFVDISTSLTNHRLPRVDLKMMTGTHLLDPEPPKR